MTLALIEKILIAIIMNCPGIFTSAEAVAAAVAGHSTETEKATAITNALTNVGTVIAKGLSVPNGANG